MAARKKNTNQFSVSSHLSSLPTCGRNLESRLTPDQQAQLAELAYIYNSEPHKIQRVGWERLAKEYRRMWGLKTLSSRTLRRAVCDICYDKEQEE